MHKCIIAVLSALFEVFFFSTRFFLMAGRTCIFESWIAGYMSVRATIRDSLAIKGIRKSVYQSAAKRGGYYTTTNRADSIQYNGQTMLVHIAFESLSSARKFAGDLEELNEFRLQIADVGRAEPYGGVLSHKLAVYLRDYVSSDSVSPPASASARSSSTTVSAQLPSFGITHYQRIEPLEIAGGAGFELCHIKDKKYCTAEENNDEDNYFSLSFQFHKQFDGRGGGDVPTVRISIRKIHDTNVEVDTATGGRETRVQVDLLVEFRSREAYNGFMGVLKDGSEELDHCTRWQSFVYVVDPLRFQRYVDFKYVRTSTAWE